MTIKITNQKLVNRFIDFIRDLSPEDNVAILHDMDPDGLCSALLLKKVINTLGLEPKLIQMLMEGTSYFTEDIKSTIFKHNINKIITVDKPCDKSQDDLDFLEHFEKICIIDHHYIGKKINPKKIILLKPQLFSKTKSPEKYCTSKIVYDLLMQIIDVSDYDWVAVIGIIGDSSSDIWQEFIDTTFRKHKIKLTQNILESEIGKIAELINNTRASGSEHIPKIFEELDRTKDFRKLPDALKKFAKVKNEINEFVEQYTKYSEIQKDKALILMHINCKLRLNSQISNDLSFKLQNSTVIVGWDDKKEQKTTISARRQDKKYDMNKLMKTLCYNLGGEGGGHIPAAGGSVPLGKWEEFKKQAIKRIEEFRTVV